MESIRKEDVDAEVTVAAFDSSVRSWNGIGIAYNGMPPRQPQNGVLSFDVLREEVDIKEFKDIGYTELSPRGNTPLYDATGRLLNMADKKAGKKTVILIMTDGAENDSEYYTLQSIRDRIATCQHRGWEVVFLGAEFNAENVARDYGLATSKVISTTRSAKLNDSMAFYASASASYSKGAGGIDTTQAKTTLEK